MKRLIAAAFAAALVASPGQAFAQGSGGAESTGRYVAPFFGTTFSGDADTAGLVMGAAAGWRSQSWWSVEGEAAFTPNLFEQTGFLTNRSVTTVMGNALVHYGGTQMSVFATGGFGLIRLDLAEAGGLAAVKANQPGFNVGAGAMRTWSNRVGVRGDVRYFRAAGNEDNDVNGFGLEVSKLSFWRATAALVVGF